MRHVVASIFLFLLAAASLSAATFQPVSDAALVERAELIVVGTVIDTSSRETPDRMIYTDTRLRVEQVLKGGTDQETVTISELGGYANGHGVLVPGSAIYPKGARVLAFLRARPDGSHFTAYMGLGRYRFEQTRTGIEVLVRDSEGIEIDMPDAFAARPAAEFIDYVRAGAPDSRRPAFIATYAHSELHPVANASPTSYLLTGNGFPLRWDCPSACTKEWTVGSPQQGTVSTPEAVEDTMAAWTNESGAWISLDIGGFNTHTAHTNDDINDIIFNTNDNAGVCDAGVGCGVVYFNGPPDTHSFQSETFYDIISADVLIKPVNFSSQNAFEGVLGHELGHNLGLKHGPSGSLMAPSAPSGTSLRAWDVEAVTTVYGNGPACSAPTINSTSGGGNVTQGNTKQLSVNATGTAPLSYQWYQGEKPDTSTPVGTNSNTYTTPPVNSQMKFWVRVTNGCGSADSATITVTPVDACNAPNITVEPQSQTISAGSTATLTVGATGSSPLTFQWYQGLVGDISTPVGTNSNTFTTPALQNTTTYWVKVSNNCGNDNSAVATITVSAQCVAPNITAEPQSQTINPNTTATLTVTATGTSLTYQWFQGLVGDMSTPVGTNSNTFTTPSLQNTTNYWVKVSNGCGEDLSALATITVTGACVPVTFATQPGNLNLAVGTGATLNVSVNGTAPITFQWYQGDSPNEASPIAGATNSSFPAGPFNTAGTYKFWVKATNHCGGANSSTIVITVACPSVAIPVVSAPPASHFSTGYDVTWTGDAALTSSFELQEATNASFTENLKTFVVVGALEQHILPHTEIIADTRFYYRVRAINGCTLIPTAYSTHASTVVTRPLPENSTEFSISVPVGEAITFKQNYLVPGFGETATNGDTFAITTDVPWLTVFPPSGALSAGGTTVELTIVTNGLDVGTTTGTINVVRTQPSSSRIGTTGNTTSSVPFSVSLVTPVTPTPRDATAPPGTLVIPAIAHADGIGTRFQSDVRITNASNAPLTYELTFTPSGSNGTQVGKKTTLVIGANDTKGLDDIVKAWYGSGVLGETGLGTLEIRPITTGANPLATFASSRTYAISSAGTLGQFIPAIPLANFIGDINQNALQKLSLQQIANSAAYRTNFGFVEGGGATAQILVKLLDASNNVLQQVTRTLPPFGHEQISYASLFGNVPLNDGRVEVSVTSASGKATAYASVVDNNTSDPLLVFPVQAAAFTSQHYVVPGIAELNNGASNFHSDMRVYNAGSLSVSVSLKYYPQGSATPNPNTIQRTITPGTVLAIDNVLPSLWQLDATGGAVTVDAPTDASLVVTARTYSRNSAGGTFGQFIPGVTARDAVGLGERALEVMQLEQSAQYRTNLGLAEVTGKPVTVEIMAYKPDTKTTAVTSVGLKANEFRQIGIIFQQMGLPTVYNGRVTVKVIGGEGRVAAYGSVVDNRTVDPTYVPSQ